MLDVAHNIKLIISPGGRYFQRGPLYVGAGLGEALNSRRINLFTYYCVINSAKVSLVSRGPYWRPGSVSVFIKKYVMCCKVERTAGMCASRVYDRAVLNSE